MVFGGGSGGGGGSVDLGSAHGTIRIGFAENEIDQALNRLDNTISGRLTSMGQRFQGIGSQLTMAFAPVTGFMAAGLMKFVEFDDVLTEIEARTGATAEQMELVRSTALEMGQDTAFSATDASEAMLELLASGYSLDQTFQALKPTLDAAAAGNMALGETADAVTDILAMFQLGAEDAALVANALAAGAGASSATMQDLVNSFVNVGPKAAEFGLSVEDVAAVLAVMAENGIKGSRAGTQFSSMLDTLTSGTKPVNEALRELNVSLTDIHGNYRPLNEIIQDINRAMTETQTVQVRVNNLTGEQTDRLDAAQDAYARATRNLILYNDGLTAGSIGEEERARRIQDATAIQANAANAIAEVTGSQEEAQYITMELTRTQEENFQAVRTLGGGYGDLALQALLNADGFETMQESMEQQATAAEIAAKRMSSLKGVFNTLGSTIETLSINIIGPLAEKYLIPLITVVTNLLNILNEFITTNEAVAEVLGVVLTYFALIGPVIYYFGTLLTAAGAMVSVFSASLAFLLSPIGLLIAAAFAFRAAYRANFLGIQEYVDPVLNAFEDIYNGIARTLELLFEGENAFAALRNGIGFFVDDIARDLGIPAEKAREMQLAFQGATEAMSDGFNDLLGIVDSLVVYLAGVPERLKFAYFTDGFKGMLDQLRVEVSNMFSILETGLEELDWYTEGKQTLEDYIAGIQAGLTEKTAEFIAIGQAAISNILLGVQAELNLLKLGGFDLGSLFSFEGVGFDFESLSTLLTWFGRLSSAVTLLGLLFAAFTSPIGLIIAGFAALAGAVAGAYYAFTHLDEVKGIVSNLGKNLEKGLKEALKITDSLTDTFSSAWESIRETAPEAANVIGETIGEAISGAANLISQYAPQFAQRFSQIWAGIRETLPDLAHIVGEGLGQLSALVGQFLVEHGPEIIAALVGLILAINEWVMGTAIPELMGLAQDMAVEFVKGFLEGITGESDWQSAITVILVRLLALGTAVVEWITAQAPVIAETLLSWASAFADWIVNDALPSLLQKAGELASSLGAWIIEKAPEWANQLLTWATAFGDWVWNAALPYLLVQLLIFGNGLIAWISEQAPVIMAQLLQWGQAFGDWVVNTALPWLYFQLIIFGNALFAWISEQAPIIMAQLLVWGQAFGDWVVSSALPWLLFQLVILGNRLMAWIGEQKPKLIAKLLEWASSFSDWAKGIWSDLEWELYMMYGEILGWIGEAAAWILEDVKTIGQSLVDGIEAGIEGAWQGFVDWLWEKLRSLPGIIKDFWGIDSPSKVMADIAKWIPEGIRVGIESNWDSPLNAMREMADMIASPNLMAPALAGAPVGAASGAGTVNHNTFSVTLQLPNFQGTPEQAQAIGSAAADGFEERISQLLRNNQ